MAKPELGFKIWTAFLSVFVTLMLFIVGKHSFWKSLLIAAIAVGAIWMMYFVIGQVINRAVSEELKKRRYKGVIMAVIMGIRLLL